jgi:hypothetical protein
MEFLLGPTVSRPWEHLNHYFGLPHVFSHKLLDRLVILRSILQERDFVKATVLFDEGWLIHEINMCCLRALWELRVCNALCRVGRAKEE